MAATHIIGINFQLRLGVHRRLFAQKEVAVALVGLDALCILVDHDFTVEYSCGLVSRQPFVELVGTVYNFGKKVDTLTIEIENVNIEALKALENEGVNVFPSSKTLEKIQNKATQKLFYTDHNLPTAPFKRFAFTEEIYTALEHSSIKFPFVWKRAQFGYDGTGVKVVRSKVDLENLPNVECITEDLVPFKSELAVIVARNTKGAS